MGELRRRRSTLRFIAYCIAIALVAFAAGVFIFSGRAAELFSRGRVVRADFKTVLAEFDAAVGAGESAERLESLLIAAEENALSVESGLSVLKRRRGLAVGSSSVRSGYVAASVRLASRFPHAEAAAALAAEALLAAGDPPAAVPYAYLLTEGRFLPIKAAVLVSAGRLSDASSLGQEADSVLLAASASFKADGSLASALATDAAVARLLAGEGTAALALLRDREPQPGGPLPGTESRLLAELEYDFGDARKAASLFSIEDGAAAELRRADAYTLVQDWEGAREAWKSVAMRSDAPSIAGIALYDLAATVNRAAVGERPEAARAEEEAYLQRLLTVDGGNVAGAIRLSRLFDDSRGEAVLDAAEAVRSDGLLDLERIRRSSVSAGPPRTVAALWLLMNARPQDRRIAQWSAYYMENYGAEADLAKLLEAARRNGFDEPWLDFHEALRAAREGRLDDAERGLARAANRSGDWRLAADLAVVAEGRRSIPLAIERYEIAASLVSDQRSAATLQVRIARCLEALGKDGEARRALGYALELDPDNRTARLELQLLDGRDSLRR